MITDRGEYKKTNMENVKMLILDIDGTLIARGSETIRPAVVEALHQAQRQEIKLS